MIVFKIMFSLSVFLCKKIRWLGLFFKTHSMGFTNVVEILVMGAQFLALTASYDVRWPAELSFFTTILSYLVKVPILPDIRMQHIAISYLCPILLSLVIILCFKSIFAVLKELVGLFAWIGLAVGIYGYFKNYERALELIYLCGALVCLFLIEATFRGIYDWHNKKMEKLMVEDDKSEKELHDKAIWKQIRNLLLIIICISLAILSITTTFYVDTLYIIIVVVISLFLVYNFVSNLFEKGRLFNTKLNYYFRKHIVQVILFLLTFLYIPITLNSLRFIIPSKYLLYNKDVTCSDTQLIKMKMPFAPYNFGSNVCLDTRNNVNNVNMTLNDYKLSGPIFEERFYQVDTTIPFYTEVVPYFLPGSIAAFLLIALGMPYLYYKLVKICYLLINMMPLKSAAVLPVDTDAWIIKSSLSNNCCKSLYGNLNANFKDFKLILLAYRFLLVVVISLTYVPNISNSAWIFIVVAFVHFIGIGLVLKFKPFTHYLENTLFVTLQGLNVILALLGGCLAFQIIFPSFVYLIVLCIILSFPVLAIVAGSILDYKRTKKRKIDINWKPNSEMVNLTAEELRTADMRMDKQLQFPIVGYFTMLMMMLILSAALSIYGITINAFTYNISNARVAGNLETGLHRMTKMDQLDYAGPYRSCADIQLIISHCTCVEMHLLANDQTEVWKCDHGIYRDDLIILERRGKYDSDFDGLGKDIRPFCSTTFNMAYLNANITLNLNTVPEEIDANGFSDYWDRYC